MENNSNRFSYIKYDDKAMKAQAALKRAFEDLECLVELYIPHGRSRALCLTALEEAYMWTGKGIRDEQIARTGQVAEQAERGDTDSISGVPV